MTPASSTKLRPDLLVSQYVYALGAGDLLILSDLDSLAKAGIPAEQEVVTKHFCYFGPVPESLYAQIKDDDWRAAFRSAARLADTQAREQPFSRLDFWGKTLGEAALEMLSGTTSLDPRARLTIDQVLALPYWTEE
jgi:hypothetical protein